MAGVAFCAPNGTSIVNLTRLRNLLFGLASVLMLGHSLVPHEHSGNRDPKFILWELFSVDLGSDHLQHFAPTSCESAPEDANQQQLPARTEFQSLSHVAVPRSTLVRRPSGARARAHGHLSSWSRRPPPSKIA